MFCATPSLLLGCTHQEPILLPDLVIWNGSKGSEFKLNTVVRNDASSCRDAHAANDDHGMPSEFMRKNYIGSVKELLNNCCGGAN